VIQKVLKRFVFPPWGCGMPIILAAIGNRVSVPGRDVSMKRFETRSTLVRLAAAFCFCLIFGSHFASARMQAITPLDAAEKAHFERLVGAVERAGYANPFVVALGQAQSADSIQAVPNRSAHDGCSLQENSSNPCTPCIVPTHLIPIWDRTCG
jgi:hypothetical protein